jgi:hypothetical protein
MRRDDAGRVAVRRLRTARVQAAADAPLRVDLVGCPDRAAVARRQRRARAFEFTGQIGAERGLVDLRARNPGVRTVDLPGRRDATGEIQLEAGGMALPREQVVGQRLAGG